MHKSHRLSGAALFRGDSVAILSLALIIFSGYMATLAPDIEWLDSSELQTVAIVLGNGHPPGEPLYSMIAHALRFLPVGSLAFRMNVVSASMGVIASIAVYALLIQIAVLMKRRVLWYDRLFAFGLTLSLAFSHALWIQTTRSEVYSLNFLLTVVIVLAVVHSLRLHPKTSMRNVGTTPDIDRRIKLYLLIAFLLGLACGNHPLLIALLGPPILLFMIVPGLPALRLKGILLGLLLFLLGLSIYFYLPLRASAFPPVNWGNPNSLDRIIWMMSASMFQKSFVLTVPILIENVKETLYILMSQLTVYLFLPGLLGLWIIIRKHFKLGGFLISGLLFNLLSVVTQQVFIGTNPDLYGYLLFSILILIIGVYGTFSQILEMIESHGHPKIAGCTAAALIVMLLATSVVSLPATLKAANKHDTYSANLFGKRILNAAAPGSHVVTSNIETLFTLWYLQHVECYRQDVTIIHSPFVAFDWYQEDLLRRNAKMTSIPMQGVNSIADLLPRIDSGPVYFELGIGVTDTVVPYLTPNGLIFEYSARTRPLDPSLLDRQQLRMEAAHALMTADENDIEALKAIYWQHYLHGIFYAKRRLYDQSRREFEACLAITPKSQEVAKLIEQLGAEMKDGRQREWRFQTHRRIR